MLKNKSTNYNEVTKYSNMSSFEACNLISHPSKANGTDSNLESIQHFKDIRCNFVAF